MQKLQSSTTKQTQDFGVRIAHLEDELAQKEEEITRVNESLSKQSDYQELKKELQYVIIW